MILISIDVGIKNLAYCCFSVNDDKLLNNIIDWNVVDLNKKIHAKCNFCNKNASFTKNNTFYCKIHAKKCKYHLPCEKIKFNSNTKMNDLKDFANKYNIEYKDNIIKKDLLETVNTFQNENWLDIVKKQKTDYDFINIGRNLNSIFNTLFSTREIDTVIIENQIGPLAIKMKTLQGMITQYFIIKHPLCKILFVSSVNKLKEFKENNEDTKYKERKNKGITICESLINEKNINFFKSHKKKDDLADSFLQGYWYIKNNLI